jgi:hypothetical protein
MPNANWQAEVKAALSDERQQEVQANNIFNNPALARFTLASGFVTAVIGAAVYGVSTLNGVSLDDRTTLEGSAWIAAMAAFTQVTLGITALLMQPKPRPPRERKDERPAIGW